VKTLLFSGGSISDAVLDWRGRAIAQGIPIPGPWDMWLISKFSCRENGGRLTLEVVQESQIGRLLLRKVKEGLLGTLSIGDYALSSPREELGTVSDKVKQPYRIPMETGYNISKDCV